MKTSLAIIGKDESEGLKNLIGDIGKYFDEIVLVSTDHNKELIKTAKELKIKVYDEYFGESGKDFDTAAARNSSFNHATGDIIAWFDLDDRIPNGDVIPKIIEKMKNFDIEWVYCRYNYAFDQWGNVMTSQIRPRFMKKNTGVWNKTCHEDFAPIKNVEQIKDEDIVKEPLIVNHQNIITDIKQMQKKSLRNLGVMMTEYKKDGDKTDLRTIDYIGRAYLGLEQFQEAIKFFLIQYRGSGCTEDRYWALINASFCLRMLKKYNEAINILLESLKIYPRWSTSYFELADTYMGLQDYEKVIDWTLAGLERMSPDTIQAIQPLDHELYPLGRLAEAYLMTEKFADALKIAQALYRKYPKVPMVKELLETCKKSYIEDNYVKSLITTIKYISIKDRVKGLKIFDCIPTGEDDDLRIQQLRWELSPPKNWSNKSIVIFCGDSQFEWAYPSIYTGVGGSEESVIYLSKELVKSGYEVTVYNKCGKMAGVYDGVEYKPYYHFNYKDNFNYFISWRNPEIFREEIKAKQKIVWLHDMMPRTSFNEKIIKNIDKFIYVSKYQRVANPEVPEDKIYYSAVGVEPSQFKKVKKEPNSLFWGSSYDRGLLPFIENILPMIEKEIPDVKMHICYGWNTIDKSIEEGERPDLKELRKKLTPYLENKENIIHYGTVSHQKVIDLMEKCMVYPYASRWPETYNNTSQKCQIANCYVISTSTAGGTLERVKFGEIIKTEDIYTDKKAQKEFSEAVIKYLKNPKENTFDIMTKCSWKYIADEWRKKLLD